MTDTTFYPWTAEDDGGDTGTGGGPKTGLGPKKTPVVQEETESPTGKKDTGRRGFE